MINKNNIMLVTALLLVLALNPVLSDLARAQVQYPSKTIQILLPLAVGSAGDLGARKLAGEITRITKQSGRKRIHRGPGCGPCAGGWIHSFYNQQYYTRRKSEPIQTASLFAGEGLCPCNLDCEDSFSAGCSK
jgi:hypothetical protein